MKHIILTIALLAPALSACAVTVTTPVQPLSVTSTTKEDCKNGGWQWLETHEGESFKNQGECVSYFAARK